jgi:AraC-like DNA-binding protein
MSIIATLLSHSTQLQRLKTALRDRHELRECDDWITLAHTCDREPVCVAVVDLYVDGALNLERVRQIKRRLPRLTMVAYISMAPERAHDLFDAALAGVDGLVFVGDDDAPRQLLAMIEKSEATSLVGLIRRSLEGQDSVTADASLLAVTRAHERLDPAALSRLLAQPRRAVTRRLAASGFPPPRRLLTWGRLIVAAQMLEDGRRSADRVARTLGFPSGSAFRNMCQRYVHATPAEIRARGGAAYVVRCMLRHVDARTSHARRPHRRSAARLPAIAL